MREPAEMRGGFRSRFADDGYVQAAANHGGDVAKGYALLGDGMIAGMCGTAFEHQPVKMRGIEPVHRGPAIAAVADISRDAFLARETDEVWDEAVIAVAVDRGREAHD